MRGWIKWNTRTKTVIAALGLAGGIAAVLLGNTIASCDVVRYEYIRFVADPDETTTWSHSDGEGKVWLYLSAPGECLRVGWDEELPAPSLTRFGWGYVVRAASGHGLDHNNAAEGEDVCLDLYTLWPNYEACPWCDGQPLSCPCSTWTCQYIGSMGSWCDTATETGGGASGDMDAGETCE